MTTLYVIRHSKTLWNLEKRMQGSLTSPLLEEGIKKAISLGSALRDTHFDAYYVSPSRRARDTASHIFANISPYVHTGLDEIAMGEWEGQTFDAIAAQSLDNWDAFFNRPHDYQPTPGGESYEALSHRVKAFLEFVTARHPNGIVAVVSHRITLKVMLSLIETGSLRGLSGDTDIDSNAVSIIDIDPHTRGIVRMRNITDYTLLP